MTKCEQINLIFSTVSVAQREIYCHFLPSGTSDPQKAILWQVCISNFCSHYFYSGIFHYFSYERVDNGQPHVLEMLIHRKNFTMMINQNGQPRTVINEGPKEYLDVTDDLYLGGLPADVNTRAFKKWHIRDGTSFRGELHHSCYFLGKNKNKNNCYINDIYINCLFTSQS